MSKQLRQFLLLFSGSFLLFSAIPAALFSIYLPDSLGGLYPLLKNLFSSLR